MEDRERGRKGRGVGGEREEGERGREVGTRIASGSPGRSEEDEVEATKWMIRAAEGGHEKALRSRLIRVPRAPWTDYDHETLGAEWI